MQVRTVGGRRTLAPLLGAFVFTLAAGAPAQAGDPPRPAAGGTPWRSVETAALRRDVAGILAADPVLHGAHVGFLAVETGTGRVLAEHAAGDAFMPASAFKVLTGSAAMAVLGPDFRFRTTVSVAPEAGGVRLTLTGGGDALLSVRDLDDAAAAVASAVTEPVVAAGAATGYLDSARYLSGWAWDDFPYAFSPVLSALSFEDNAVHAVVRPGAPGERATIALSPDAGVAFENRVATGAPGSKDTVDIRREGDAIVFVGSIPAGGPPDELDAAVPDPPRYALGAFVRALAAHGVRTAVPLALSTGAAPPPGARVVWRHDSARLARYLADFWNPSDNLIGEMLLEVQGVVRAGSPGTSAAGAALERDWLRAIGIDPSPIDITDGSGLSMYDRISPRALVALLQYDWHGPNRDAFVDALPLAGYRGTLHHKFAGTPAWGRVFAKTGTRRYARALCGYVRPVKHGAVTFALLVDDWTSEDDAALDRLRARLLARFIVDAPHR